MNKANGRQWRTNMVRFSSFLAAWMSLAGLYAGEPLTADPLPDGTDAAKKAIAALQIPAGLQVELFAAEPQLGNPVAICVDEKNRVYVAEQYRFNRGTEENRTRPFLLNDDLQLKTTADRLAMFQKFADRFEGGMSWFTKYTDQVRQLTDTNGDGRADRSTVFASGFNGPLDGLAAGVIARDGDVYLTNVPKLWRLRDTNDDGQADEKTALLDGFGVNAAFLGHDLHGLVWGPDGKLYFSIGDRGYHVVTKEGRTLSEPRRGAVFRCDADGRNLEVVHRGLRNPQELAFDEFGNLFADDNNCDKGDHSRLVLVVEGGDSGWNMAYQTLVAPYLTGPWHAEKTWHLANDEQPACIVPPVGKLGAGPSGFAYYPGTGLPERYRGHFFMCNYTGNGIIDSFAVKPKGAAFEIEDMHEFLKPMKATDVEFGYDGKMYVSDYVNLEWGGGSKGGRVYTLFDPQRRTSAVVQQVEKLFREGFRHRDDQELAALLGHVDMRVRQRAQFALAERGAKVIPLLRKILNWQQLKTDETQRFARLHALWALGMLTKVWDEATIGDFTKLLGNEDVHLASQAAKVLSQIPVQTNASVERNIVLELDLGMVRDELPIRFQAAMAVGKRKQKASVPHLFTLLKENDETRDRYIRHAAVFALAEIGDREAVIARLQDPVREVRLGALLVLRRWQDANIVRFLDDADWSLVTEAARAINDLPLDTATPQLAALAERLGTGSQNIPEPLVRRIIHANFRLGEAQHAAAIARIAALATTSDAMRQEALAALADWATPSPRDRVTGNWRPLPNRSGEPARNELQQRVAEVLQNASTKLRPEIIKLLEKMRVDVSDATLLKWVHDAAQRDETRIAVLQLLATKKHAQLEAIADQLLTTDRPQLRAAARVAMASVAPDRATKLQAEVLSDRQSLTVERQAALLALAELKTATAQQLLEQSFADFIAGKLPLELQVELIELAETATSAVGKQAKQHRQTELASAAALLAKFAPAAVGGDATRGQELFTNHRAAQCVRCHKVNGQGGEAGPDLSKVATRGDRNYLLQSLLEPSAKIAPGFGTVTLVLNNGQVLAGTVKAETPESLTIVTPMGQERKVLTSDIDERTPIQSPMPVVSNTLTLRDLRDLVEYLATLK